MTATQILRLYPRAFRERYADEIIALVGDGPLTTSQIVSLVSGAIDARLSSDVGHLAAASHSRAATSSGGSTVVQTLRRTCATKNVATTPRDGLISAALMIGVTFALVTLGLVLNRQGMRQTGEFFKGLAFPVSMVAILPMYLKGQSWRVHAIIMGGTIAIICAIFAIAVKL